MPQGRFRNGVTRNESTKCWLARIKRQTTRHSCYFFDNRCGGKDEAHRQALEWYNKISSTLPPPTSTKGIKTSRNHSGVVGVSLRKEVQNKSSGARYVYWTWNANWPGCPNTSGISWRAHVHGDEDAFVLAYLARQYEIIDRKALTNELLRIKGTEDYEDILKHKIQKAP